MRRTLTGALFYFALAVLFHNAVAAQTVAPAASGNTCEGRAFSRKDVESPAVIRVRPKAQLTDEARANGTRGQIRITAVLCRSGQVTDIQVIEGLPAGMTEKVVDQISRLEFTPARIAGEPVSQVQNFTFHYDYIGSRRPLATGRLDDRAIDSVTVEGYSQSVSRQIKECTNTLAGSFYSQKLVDEIYQRLLQVENFDPKTSEIRIEESFLGGLGIVYLLHKETDGKP